MNYLVRRVLGAVPLLIGISALLFLLMQRVPGGPLAVYGSNPHVHPADLLRLKHAMGLDQPLYFQYLKWLWGLLHGNLGFSLFTGRPVMAMILERTPNTLVLMGISTAVSLLVGLVLGIVSALRPYSKLDYGITTVAFLGYSLPTFWFGTMLLMVFAAELHWLPAGGMHTIGARTGILPGLPYLLMPATVLSIVNVASWSRFMRGSMREALQMEFVRMARAKGLSEWTVVGRHAMRNALIPVITVVMMAIPGLFGGAVVTETIFDWPGLGRLFFDALGKNDYPVLMGVLIISSVLVVASNLLADLLYAAIDPRIRLE